MALVPRLALPLGDMLSSSGGHNTIPSLEGLVFYLFSPSSGGWTSKVEVSVGLVSPEAPLFGLQTPTFSQSTHGLSSAEGHP